jgi:Peptidase family S41
MKKLFFTLSCFVFLSDVVYGQSLHNPNFIQLSDTSKTGLAYWDLSWGGKGAVRSDKRDGFGTMLIAGQSDNSVGFSEQRVDFPTPKETEILTITASILTENVRGKGAGLNLSLFDKDGNSILNMDTGGGSVYSTSWIKGTNSWKDYSVSVVCPMGTSGIRIGAILYGNGKAWYRNIKVDVKPVDGRKPSRLAVHYISVACDLIKKNSVVRDSLNIDELKKNALKVAGPAKTYGDCYLAVKYLIGCLRPYGDEHSFLMTKAEKDNWETKGSEIIEIENPTYKSVNGYGYLHVPAFHGGNPKMVMVFADSLQTAMRKLYADGIKGWVVDLRGNTGGNQDPMILGLGPLFSSVKLGSLVDVNNHDISWNYDRGRYFFSDDTTSLILPHPFIPPVRLPIAVLIDNRTGSSGEIVAISFVGNKLTRSFGQPTWGLTTGNGAFLLPDGSEMRIASTHMADRNGKMYPGSVTPDIIIMQDKQNGSDNTLAAALAWLKSLKE